MLFLIFERGINKKIPQAILILTILFLIFEELMGKNNWARNFKIRNYASFNI